VRRPAKHMLLDSSGEFSHCLQLSIFLAVPTATFCQVVPTGTAPS
jgi:hypothetical protein